MARKFIKRKSAVKPITGSIVDTKNIIDKTTNTYSANVIDGLIGTSGGGGSNQDEKLLIPEPEGGQVVANIKKYYVSSLVQTYATEDPKTSYASIILEIDPNSTYLIKKSASQVFTVGTFSSRPVNGSTANQVSENSTGTKITITSGTDDKYMAITFWSSDESVNIIEIYETLEVYLKNTNNISAIMDLIYPIGRGFIDFTDTDYSHWLGLTWERELIGMTPIGKDANDTDFATIGKTGGAKSISYTPKGTIGGTAITQAQLPAVRVGVTYQNTYPITGNSDTLGTFTKTDRAITFSTASTNEGDSELRTKPLGSGSTHTHSWTGTAQNISTIQPYQVVSYWKRVEPNTKTMINFTIAPGGTNTGDSVIYQAEEGMTFLEWYNSDYNTWDTNKSYYNSTSDTFSSGGSNLYCENKKTSKYIYGKDTIINGTIVYWYSSER